MGNPKTLKPFQAGHDPRRNMKGRPKGSSDIREVVRMEMEKEVVVDGVRMSNEHAIIQRFIKDAIKGKVSAFSALMNRLYGKPGKHCPGCNCQEVQKHPSPSDIARKAHAEEEVRKILDRWKSGSSAGSPPDPGSKAS